MSQLNTHKKSLRNPPPSVNLSTPLYQSYGAQASELPLLKMVKTAYLIWYSYYQILPKTHRFTLGGRIDNLFVTIIEAIAAAGFLPPEEKRSYVQLAIRKQDALKVLLEILWETKSLNAEQYLTIATPLVEIGKRLGGWQGQINKALSLSKAREK